MGLHPVRRERRTRPSFDDREPFAQTLESIRQNVATPGPVAGNPVPHAGCVLLAPLPPVRGPGRRVARDIQRQRLKAALARLHDPAEPRTIARIAEDLGFPDRSGFSRAFKAEFGLSPSAARGRR
ncbi:helix-turn-helix domain-containing protein [Xanthobacter agilis]|uniref:AraC-like DNA-binding protein n=1 Tax=Xanthobacter agilis TaxID=47492 RepID=A0ABU0LBX6_XANAG|nr:helix-turn-helix domain-containing protein [Xanthobacter agilis]MDQ0504636.1 AraC-like DNA-binding protein [Xanthobacter agilis]